METNLTLPIITILHCLPDRVRLHFSVPPRNVENLRENLLQDSRIWQMTYSPVSRTCVLSYDHKDVELLHVLKMIVILLADEYHRQPVYILPKDVYRLSPLTTFSAVAILVASISRLAGLSATAGSLSGWTAVGSTAAAVIEHAYIEIKRTGSFDPEALSIVYLINSAGRREFIRGALFTWLASFSRHLMRFPHLDGLKMSFVEGFNEMRKEKYLDVVTSGSISMSSLEGRSHC